MMMEATIAATSVSITSSSSSTASMSTRRCYDDSLNDNNNDGGHSTMTRIAAESGEHHEESLYSSSSECSANAQTHQYETNESPPKDTIAASDNTTPPSPSCLPAMTTREKMSSFPPVETESSPEAPEKEELLKQLLEAVDLLAKFASLDASVYHQTLSRSLQGSDTGMSRRSQRTEQQDEDEKEGEEDATTSSSSDDDLRLLFARLESLQTRHEFQQTSIPNLILSLHRWQAQLNVMQQHQSQHVHEVQELQEQLVACTRREAAWKKSCLTLQQRHDKVSRRLHEKKSLLRRAREYCRTVQHETVMLREENAIYQLQAHEQIMAWQKQQIATAAAVANTAAANAATAANDNNDDTDTDDYDLRLRLGSTDTGTCTCTSSSSNFSNADAADVALEFPPDASSSTAMEAAELSDSSIHSQSTGIGGGDVVCKNSTASSFCSIVTNDGVAVVRFGPPGATASSKPKSKDNDDHTHDDDDEPSESSILSSTTTCSTSIMSETRHVSESLSLSLSPIRPPPAPLLLQELPHVASRTVSPPYQIRFSRHSEQLGIRIRSIPLDELPKPPPKPLIALEMLLLLQDDDDVPKEQQQQKLSLLRLSPNARGGSSTNTSTGGFFNHFLMGHHGSHHHGGEQQQQKEPTTATGTTGATSSTTGLAFVVSGFGSAWDATRNPIKPTLGARILNINGHNVDPSWTLPRMLNVLTECQKQEQTRKQSLDDDNNNDDDESSPSPSSTTRTTGKEEDENDDDDYFTITFRNDPLSKQQKESILLANNSAATAPPLIKDKDKNNNSNSNRAAAAAAINTSTNPEPAAAAATETTPHNHSSFNLNFLKLGLSNHTSSHTHLQQQQQTTAVVAPTVTRQETTESSILAATELTATDTSIIENKDHTTEATNNGSNDDSANTTIKEKPKSSRGFLSSWMNEVEANETQTMTTATTISTLAAAAETVPPAKKESVGPEETTSAAGTSPTKTLNNDAVSENMAQCQAPVESSESSSSSSSAVPSPVVVDKSTSGGSLGFHAPRIHLPFWNMGSSYSNSNSSGANNEPTAAAVELKSIESPDATVAASATKDHDQTTDQGNCQVDDSYSQEANDRRQDTRTATGRTGSDESIAITATSPTDLNDTASKSVGQCQTTMESKSSSSSSAVPLAVVENRSSSSSGTLSFHAPRIHLPFWNMGRSSNSNNSSNSVTDNKPTVATAELKSIESLDTVVEALQSNDNDQSSMEHDDQNYCQKVVDSNSISQDANSISTDTITAATEAAAAAAPPLQQQQQHQQQEATVHVASDETCSSKKEAMTSEAIYEKKDNDNNNNSPISKMLGGFSNPFM